MLPFACRLRQEPPLCCVLDAGSYAVVKCGEYVDAAKLSCPRNLRDFQGNAKQRGRWLCILANMSVDPHQEERERQYEVARQQRVAYKAKPRGSAGIILFGLFLFFVLGIAGAVALLRHVGGNGVAARVAGFLLRGRDTFTASAPDVVNQIQRLNRLETVSYSVDTVVEGKHTNAVLPDLLFGDRLLLVVHGQVVAGVDLSQLKPESVQVNGRAVTLELPPSQIFTTRIDNNKTKVFARTTGLLVKADPNLETDTRQMAEQQILEAATKDGILDVARTNARNGMESLLRGLGFQQITVR